MKRKTNVRTTKYEPVHAWCGQSRFEPMKREAMDGKSWWCLWDHRMMDWAAFFTGRYKSRRMCLIDLYLFLIQGRLPFEPDDENNDIAWLMNQDILEMIGETIDDKKKEETVKDRKDGRKGRAGVLLARPAQNLRGRNAGGH